jgi:hypothetical protein
MLECGWSSASSSLISPLVDQGLHVRVVHGAKQHLALAEMVDARIAGMHPVAVATRVDEKGRDGAVRFLLRRHGGQFDHQVRLFDDLAQQSGRIVGVRVEALEQLAGRQHDLVGRLAAATATAHAIGHHRQQAAGLAGVVQQADLILLVVAVSPVDAGGRVDAVAFGHAGVRWQRGTQDRTAIKSRC